MTSRNRAILLIVIQCVLVSSIAAKYLYERATRPRVWVRAAQYDPELPMRGRYLALQPEVDVCGLTPASPAFDNGTPGWYEVRLVARDGKLVAEDAHDRLPRGYFSRVMVIDRTHCERAPVWPAIDYFVPENARSPFPLKPGQELWVEVTVPPSGPPRAIQLALSDNGKWEPLKFE
jgi:hypothetical protein